MPISVQLCIKKEHPELLKMLQQYLPLAVFPITDKTTDGELWLEVNQLFLAEDVYHKKYELTPEELDFFKPYEDVKVITTERLKYPNILGKFNLPLIKFIKHCVHECNAYARIQYLHERGDYPYELAHWVFTPQETMIERLSIDCYDGTNKVKQYANLVRFDNNYIRMTDFKRKFSKPAFNKKPFRKGN